MTIGIPPSRVLVAGATTWADRVAIEDALAELAARKAETGGSFRVITGMADGADEVARTWATVNNVNLLAEPLGVGEYPGPMHRYNEQMLQWRPELVLAFKENFDDGWRDESCVAGTEHMCRIAAAAGVPVLLNGVDWLAKAGSMAHDDDMDDPEFAARAMWGGSLIRVVLGDITKVEASVIVNAANSSLLGGGGVDGAIHRAAGPDLLEACREVVARQGGCKTGEAVMTRAGNLSAAHVVHTVGPVFTGDKPAEHDELLARCYRESLRLGAEQRAESIAFPSISTGVYRFPKRRAAMVAAGAVRSWLEEAEHNYSEVKFVCFDQDDFKLYVDLIVGMADG